MELHHYKSVHRSRCGTDHFFLHQGRIDGRPCVPERSGGRAGERAARRYVRESGLHKGLIAQIRDLLNEEYTWSNAYMIEQFIIPLYKDAELDIELERLMIDAKRSFYPNVYAYYEEAPFGINH